VLSILKKEITSYLSSLVAYVTIGVFLLVLGLFLWVFPESGILDYGYATLDSLFGTAPYLFMFLIPAITMRSLAEERKEGTFELLLTRPLADWQIVLGKYFACLLLVLFALVPTLVYYYSVYQLGTPQGNIDTGGVIGSYIGLFLLGASFAAIGLFASSVSKNQVIAFTIAVFLCFFFYSGFDSLSQLLSLQSLSLQDLGITEHYQSVSRGVLDTRDLAYFIILTGLFISLTLFVLNRQRQKQLKDKIQITSLVSLIALGILSNLTFTRFDFTKEKRFTISPVTRDIMKKLKGPVKVKVYLQGNNFPSDLKRLQRATRDMLIDLRAYSNDRVQFEFIDPIASIKGLADDEQKKAYDSLEAKGIVGENRATKTDNGVAQLLIFPEALVQFGGREIAVNLLQTRIMLSDEEVANNSIQNLEYAFSSAIKKVTSGGKPIIGFTEGHNELSDVQLNDAMKSLSDGYDQVSADLDSLKGHGGEQMSFPKQLDLDDQLFTYGVRINYDLIADMSCAQIPVTTGNAGGQAQIQLLPWLYYPLFITDSQNPIVRNLDAIRSEFASTIDTIAIKNVKKTILLTSSPYNKRLNAPHILSLQALEQEPTPKDFQSTPKTVAVLLEGEFKSDFQNRPLPEGLNENVPILPKSVPTKMIIISDGDVFKSQLGADGSPYPLGYDHYMQRNFGNKNLLLNIADYMTDDSGLIALRTKEIQIRLLSRARIRSEKLYWQVINNALPLGLLVIFAIFQHYVRKRKYAH